MEFVESSTGYISRIAQALHTYRYSVNKRNYTEIRQGLHKQNC